MAKKGRGWHGERERHSKAARGIKTNRHGTPYETEEEYFRMDSAARRELEKRRKEGVFPGRRSHLIEKLRMVQAERDVHAAREREIVNKLDVTEDRETRSRLLDELDESSDAANWLAREIRELTKALDAMA